MKSRERPLSARLLWAFRSSLRDIFSMGECRCCCYLIWSRDGELLVGPLADDVLPIFTARLVSPMSEIDKNPKF